MSDFDAFEASEPQQPVEEDPAAAFLAREQTELAGLDDDNFGDESSGQTDQSMLLYPLSFLPVPPTNICNQSVFTSLSLDISQDGA